MSANTITDYYGPDLMGEFMEVPATHLQEADILPSHDGMYHVVDRVRVGTDMVYAIIKRGHRWYRPESSYRAELPLDATVRVLYS